MVEQAYNLDAIFGSLSDPTRRDILQRINKKSMSVSSIAKHYKLSFAGIAKHLTVLQKAGLIHKDRQGKEQIVMIEPEAFARVEDFLNDYKELWENRLDSLGQLLTTTKDKG